MTDTRIINLPALPQSWDELTGNQMAELNRLRHRCADNEPEYLFLALCYLLGIKLTRKAVENADGGLTYLFRRINAKQRFYGEVIPMESWQVQFYISENLKYLIADCDRLQDVFPKLKLKEKKFASSGYAMAGMTYQQHLSTQRYMMEYHHLSIRLYEQSKLIDSEGATTATYEALKSLFRQRNELRYLLMAAIFTPEVQVTDKTVEGKTVHYDPPLADYVFSTDQIEREAWRFRYFPEFKAEAVIQHFSGVMLHYKKIYPLLFTEGEGGEVDFIKAEESTINALQTELGFKDFQTIYDSNAPFVLGRLHLIMEKAKAIDESNQRMRSGNSNRH